MLTSIKIGNKIAEARKKKNLSQAQLAKYLCISSQAVGKWERGESMPDIITLNRLAEILDVDLNYFSEIFKIDVSKNLSNNPTTDINNFNDSKKVEWNMSEGNWVDSDFSGMNNIGERFSKSNIQNCRFVDSDLSGLILKGNNVVGSDFSKSNLSKSQLIGSYIINSFFNDSSFTEINFSDSFIKNCDLTNVNFTGMIVKSSAFSKDIIIGAILKQTQFISTGFIDMVFEGLLEDCSFENCKFTRTSFQNTTLINTFFKNNNLKKVRFIDCKADRLTYAFLKNGKADMTGITLLSD